MLIHGIAYEAAISCEYILHTGSKSCFFSCRLYPICMYHALIFRSIQCLKVLVRVTDAQTALRVSWFEEINQHFSQFAVPLACSLCVFRAICSFGNMAMVSLDQFLSMCLLYIVVVDFNLNFSNYVRFYILNLSLFFEQFLIVLLLA